MVLFSPNRERRYLFNPIVSERITFLYTHTDHVFLVYEALNGKIIAQMAQNLVLPCQRHFEIL